MGYREHEYAALGLNVRWLDSMRAKNAYEYALKYSSSKRYGLNEANVTAIEQCLVESKSIAIQWLRSRLSSSGTVQVVYSESEVRGRAVADAIEAKNALSALLAVANQDPAQQGAPVDAEPLRGPGATEHTRRI